MTRDSHFCRLSAPCRVWTNSLGGHTASRFLSAFCLIPTSSPLGSNPLCRPRPAMLHVVPAVFSPNPCPCKCSCIAAEPWLSSEASQLKTTASETGIDSAPFKLKPKNGHELILECRQRNRTVSECFGIYSEGTIVTQYTLSRQRCPHTCNVIAYAEVPGSTDHSISIPSQVSNPASTADLNYAFDFPSRRTTGPGAYECPYDLHDCTGLQYWVMKA